jgi:hypothetical protein
MAEPNGLPNERQSQLMGGGYTPWRARILRVCPTRRSYAPTVWSRERAAAIDPAYTGGWDDY